MKQLLIMIGAVMLLSGNCKKDGGKACWQAFSRLGADVTGLVLCDKTKTEAEAAYPAYWFYKQGETKYCWRADKPGDPFYPKYLFGIPESMKANMENADGYALTKIDCSSFCNLKWAEKHKSKITGNFGPTLVIYETLLNADSCSKLFIGRVVIVRETSDSLITREVLEKKP